MTGDQDTLETLLGSEHLTPPTREVLEARLNARYQRRFLSEEEFGLLRAAAVRLVPHDPDALDLAGNVDDRLAHGRSDGWRYADTPPDGEALRALLAALPGTFARLSAEVQDAHLQALEHQFPHPFEDLLSELTEAYYSHPRVQLALGYVGFADVPGWQSIGLNQPEPREQAFPSPEVQLDTDL